MLIAAAFLCTNITKCILKLGNNVENNDWVLHFLTHGNII